jgi:hypothetical protein
VVENVKASVPGTRQAQEAVIANAIPQTATVERTGTMMDPAPTIDGDPQYRAIEGTTLRYVLNASAPIIETGPSAFYAVQNGVWFDAGAPTGPWFVAATVPAEPALTAGMGPRRVARSRAAGRVQEDTRCGPRRPRVMLVAPKIEKLQLVPLLIVRRNPEMIEAAAG